MLGSLFVLRGSSDTSFFRTAELVHPRFEFRHAQYLTLGAKSRALLHGRFNVAAEDVRAIAKPVMRHRIYTNFNADAEGVSSDDVVEMLLAAVPEPRSEDYKDTPAPAGA